MNMQKLRNLEETIWELAVLAKACLTTFWFWVPPLFAIYMYLQLWMMFFVHPLTLAILPTILFVYAIIEENKRTRAMYGLDIVKKKTATDPLGSIPREVKGFRWDVEKALESYEKTLKDEAAKKKERKNQPSSN
jgi:hypothetical protein